MPQGDKIRFEINIDAAEHAGLKISAQLQKLATVVRRSRDVNGMRLLRDVPIQRKLTIISMLTSGLALLVAGLAFVAYEQVVFRGSMVERVSVTASMVADNSSAALMFNDPASAAATLKSLGAEDPHIVGAAIYDAERQAPLRSTGAPGAAAEFEAPSVEREGHRFDGGYLRMFRAINLAGEHAGTVYIQPTWGRCARAWGAMP